MTAQTGKVRAQIFDDSWEQIRETICIPLPTTLIGAGVAALPAGGFAIAWNQDSGIKLRIYDATGESLNDHTVGISNSQIPELQLVAFSTGEIGASWQESLIIQQLDSRANLSSISYDAFHSTLLMLPSERLLRIITTEDHPVAHRMPPRYGFNGKLFDRFGHTIQEFSQAVPAAVVDDTYSHPQHLSSCVLNGGGFVVSWTQLAHHRGNSIRAQVFAEHGEQVVGIINVAEASQTSSVNASSVAPLRNGGFVIGWSENDRDLGEVHNTQTFSSGGTPDGNAKVIDSEPNESRSNLSLETMPNGEVVGLWSEDQQIVVESVAAD